MAEVVTRESVGENMEYGKCVAMVRGGEKMLADSEQPRITRPALFTRSTRGDGKW